MTQVTIEGVMDFNLFGQKIPLNYVVEGTNCAIENFEDVAAQVEQGILPLNAVLISRNDDFYLRFTNPSKNLAKLNEIHDELIN